MESYKRTFLALLALCLLSMVPQVLAGTFYLPNLVEGSVTDASGNPVSAGTHITCVVYRDDGSADTYSVLTGAIEGLEANQYELAVAVVNEGSDRVNVTAYTSTMKGSASAVISGDPTQVDVVMSQQQGVITPPEVVTREGDPDYMSPIEREALGDEAPPAGNTPPAGGSAGTQPPTGTQPPAGSIPLAVDTPPAGNAPPAGGTASGDNSGILIAVAVLAVILLAAGFILKNKKSSYAVSKK